MSDEEQILRDQLLADYDRLNTLIVQYAETGDQGVKRLRDALEGSVQAKLRLLYGCRRRRRQA